MFSSLHILCFCTKHDNYLFIATYCIAASKTLSVFKKKKKRKRLMIMKTMKAKNIDLYDVRSNWELCFDQYQIRAPLKLCIESFHVMS